MKALRRWLIRLAVIAAALAALMALVVGLVAENYFPRAVSELDGQLGRWTLKRESFDRGWWSSRAALVAESDARTPVWRYRERLSHGPLLHGWTRLGWIGGRGTLELADGEALAELVWWLSPGMKLRGQVDFEPGAHTEGSLDIALGDLFTRVDFEVRRLSFEAPGAAGFEGLEGSGQATMGPNGLDATLELNGRRAQWHGAAIDGPALTIQADQAGELIGLRVDLSAAHAGLEQSYRDGRFDIVLERLHRPTLEALSGVLARIAKAGLPPAVRDRQLGENLLLALPGLLQHRPRITLEDLQADAPQGPFTANATIGLARTPPPGYLAEPATLIRALDLAWDVELPDALARHWLRLYLAARGVLPEQLELGVEEILQRLGADGMVVYDGERLRSRARLADERLEINGQPVPLPEF